MLNSSCVRVTVGFDYDSTVIQHHRDLFNLEFSEQVMTNPRQH